MLMLLLLMLPSRCRCGSISATAICMCVFTRIVCACACNIIFWVWLRLPEPSWVVLIKPNTRVIIRLFFLFGGHDLGLGRSKLDGILKISDFTTHAHNAENMPASSQSHMSAEICGHARSHSLKFPHINTHAISIRVIWWRVCVRVCGHAVRRSVSCACETFNKTVNYKWTLGAPMCVHTHML